MVPAMKNPIRSGVAHVAGKIPKPLAHAMSPWAKIPGGPTVLRGIVLLAPIPFLLKPVLNGYIDGVTAPKAATLAKGVTDAATRA